ncbi:transporter substrate-binding domain-containing protein [uncultured Ellagibacter sp.]|uniref:transporter substrate-binding domain-containing protein n=1 Tax=uncultured Ellagibacter sp. TaxID=2137580 RepID=UPI0025D31051|nr:transporter substrate-binding domain-containing protein [uncultured Ellagibacter sp.]
MSGWGYEYLQDISYHTEGWKYEYVLGTFSELIAKHEAGEIDLMSNISYTPERAENLLYSTNPSGKERYYIYVKSDRDDLTVGDPALAEDAQRAHDAGMNGHLTKPIDMEKVKQALAANALPVLRSPAADVLPASASRDDFRRDLADVRAVRHYGSISCVAKVPP